jgi:hypothetical protein
MVVTPVNARPVAAIPAANTSDPWTPKPADPIIAAAIRRPPTRLVINATINVAVSGAERPTTSARISSARPVCSSSRVWRTTSRMLISAAITPKYRP